MELTTITMDRTEARKRFLEYRASIRARHSREDEQIMRGYRALSQGKQIIDLPATIRHGGAIVVPGGRWDRRPTWAPRLAVMRADQPWCHVWTKADGSVTFHHEGDPKTNETRNVVRLPVGTLPAPPPGEQPGYSYWSLRAMVPPVPPALRPADNIGNYHVLWEAEWERVAPKDPALLKHIGGDLYAVLAVWDLTELERSVLGGRFTR